MHCLYCDRPLALLKRLTGDGEFCSKEHRKIYQREHSQLALARLLEGKQAGAGIGKPRPSKAPPVKLEPPPPPALPPVEVPAENQPGPAGFFSDNLEAIGASGAVQSVGVPRLKTGTPVWGGATAFKALRPGPGPRAAIFFTEFPRPRALDSAVRRPDRSPVQPAGRQLQLGEIRHAAAGILSTRQLSGAGFLVARSFASLAPGTARRTSEPRFIPLAQSKGLGATPGSGKAIKRGILPAKFVSSVPAGLAAANQARLPDGTPRWQPLDHALPQREPGKITLVLGALLQRPVRPASYEQIPETFEIPFQPVLFPPNSPRMGCLDERQHRTDRIGFSPP